MNRKIDTFTQISRNNSIFFEEYLKWDEYIFEKENLGKLWFMDEELISIYGSKEYAKLTEFQKKYLSYIELCQILYVYAFCESILCLFMAREIPKYLIGSSVHNFLVREQIEEYRHQDMFTRMLYILESGHIEIGSFWKWAMRMEAKFLPSKYFFVIQTAIELLTSDFGEKCIKNIEVYIGVRDISLIHEMEEIRHIAFAKIMMDDYFKESSFLGRSIGGLIIIIDVILINMHYIQKENFKKLGVINYKQFYKIGGNNWKNNRIKNFSSKKGMEFLNRYGFITGANSWAFKLLLGFKI